MTGRNNKATADSFLPAHGPKVLFKEMFDGCQLGFDLMSVADASTNMQSVGNLDLGDDGYLNADLMGKELDKPKKVIKKRKENPKQLELQDKLNKVTEELLKEKKARKESEEHNNRLVEQVRSCQFLMNQVDFFKNTKKTNPNSGNLSVVVGCISNATATTTACVSKHKKCYSTTIK